VAHHTQTPASVLNAPKPTVVVTAAPLGGTRQERRHGVSIVGMTKEEGARFLRDLNSNRNTPALRVEARRGKKVRRACGGRS
jgi:hypothetical protein